MTNGFNVGDRFKDQTNGATRKLLRRSIYGNGFVNELKKWDCWIRFEDGTEALNGIVSENYLERWCERI